MTRKTRRSKSSEDASQERSGSSAKSPAGEAATASSEPGSKPAETAETAETKISLPAFGFATDLLKKDKDTVDPAPRVDAAEDQDTVPVEQATDEAEIDQADPRRIFAFADSLERNTADAEQQAAPVRLETWVAFSLADEIFALPVSPVREVVRVASITRVPHAPRPIRGVTNMRGRVIPVIDLRLRIELPETELARASRVIVVSSRGRLLGLLVDSVHQVLHIDIERVQPPPDDVMTVQSDYLCGVYHQGDQLILLLDIERALIIHEAAPSVSGAPDTDGAAS